MKKCCCCKKELSLNNFGKDKYQRGGLRYCCKKCAKKKAKKYRKDNKDRTAKTQKKYYKNNRNKMRKWQKAYYLKPNIKKRIKIQHKIYYSSLLGRDIRSNRSYGVSVSDMLEWQNYKCAICQEKEGIRQMGVDHNHETGQVRMLLCGGCNHGGKLSDNVELLRAKIEYLLSF